MTVTPEKLRKMLTKHGLGDLSESQLLSLLVATVNEGDEATIAFSRSYPYRPMDGACAASRVLQQMFAFSTGKTVESFFGDEEPEMRSVKISPTASVTVPWGRFELPALDRAQVDMLVTSHRDFGPIFRLFVRAKRKHEPIVTEFFERVGQELRTSSIYRGKAIIGCDESDFMDADGFDANRVVYSEQVERILDSTLWATLRYRDQMRRAGLSRKRSILLHGPYGTGKTLTGRRTAKEAVKYGWTFIASRPGRDDLLDLLRTARIYQPSVMFFEDVDTVASTADDSEVAELLDEFDGIPAKDGELVVVMTTNHLERIHKAMLRPGRLDVLIEIAALDPAGIERLLKVTAGKGKLAKDINFDAVHDAMRGFYPAFVAECVSRASSAAIAESNGQLDYRIGTRALIIAAESLRPQLAYMAQAQEGEPRSTLEGALQGALNGARVIDLDTQRPDYELDFSPNGKD